MIRLNEEYLQQHVPSIYASEPEQGVSDRYKFMSTLDIMNSMEKMNYFPVSAKQDNVRVASSEHAKHMIRFRHENVQDESGVVPEIVLINSHNRSFRFQMSMGMYRMICSNGMVVAESELMNVKTKHMNFDPIVLQEHVTELVKNASGIYEKIDDYRNINLTGTEQQSLAKQAADLYWGKHLAIDPDRLLESRRIEDNGSSLWKVFNVIQENITKGGIKYKFGDRNTSTRALNQIRKEVIFNQEIWTLMEALRISKS